MYADSHPAALSVALRLLLAVPGGAACLPHAERAARHQLRPHALLLPDWLGRAGLRHGSGGGTGPRGLREPGLLLALALRHAHLEFGGSCRVRGVGKCSRELWTRRLTVISIHEMHVYIFKTLYFVLYHL